MTITNEDCMAMMARYPDGYFDLAIVDPPYGSIDCSWDNADKLEAWLAEMYRVLKPDGTLICFGQQPMFSRVVTFMGKRFSHELIWEKTMAQGFVNARKMPMRAHENIAVSKVETAVFYSAEKDYIGTKDRNLGKSRKQKAKRYEGYQGVREDTIYYNDGTRFPNSMLKFPPETDTIILESNWNGGGQFGAAMGAEPTIHPTQKPVALYKRLLKLYARPNAHVLDCFLGYGYGARACHDYGYDLTACELDPDYYAAAMKRINNHMAQQRLF